VTGIPSSRFPVLRHRCIGRQGGTADGIKVKAQDKMVPDITSFGNIFRPFKLNGLALTVVEAQAETTIALRFGYSEYCCGIEAAAE